MDSLPARTCTKCGERKLLTEFYKEKLSPDGVAASCKVCKSDQTKQRRLVNKDRINQRAKELRDSKREIITEQNRAKRLRNLEKTREQSRAWTKRNPSANSAKARRRRARECNNGWEIYTEQQVLDQYGTACHLCTKEVNLEAPRRPGIPGWEDGLHIDHVLPISKGGSDTLDNVRPAHGSCNIKKGDRI